MHRLRQCLVFWLLFIFGSNLAAQNIFVLERPGTVKNFKYYQGDNIKIRTISSDTIISGPINRIFDSSIIINNSNEILIADMAAIYKKRWGYGFLQYLTIFAGAAYLGINSLNGIINDDQPVVPQETLIISGSLIAFGLALTPLTTRKFKIDNEKWRIIILDFTD
jgi:hypothetical protein